ncbi:hypothetical protein BJX61DRAFT_531813 [Aspergillus egyptiacus]|nr:hypothetical protein BJX61DRAFT_531813 [Aspergillus egyptiacus]
MTHHVTTARLGVEPTIESLRQLDSEDLQDVAVDLVFALKSLPGIRNLPSPNRNKNLLSDLLKLNSLVSSDDFDFDILLPLLRAVFNSEPDDVIWDTIYSTATLYTPSPKPIPFLNQTPEGDRPLYDDNTGWTDWPSSAEEGDVLRWLKGKIDMFREHLVRHPDIHGSSHNRRILTQPSQPLEGSVAPRKLDVAIVSSPGGSSPHRAHWSQVLIPGELKSSGDLDTSSTTWRDLGRYVREVMIGATASKSFDINQDGRKFVSVFVGYLLMNDKQLGYDPSIRKAADGTPYIEITRNGKTERIFLVELMKRAACVAGRATTCWKARREGSETTTPLVVKDSWQYPERDEEGMLLKEASDKGVVNVARHYFHETVKIDGHVDDISTNVRRDLQLSSANFHRPTRSGTSTREDEGPVRRSGADHPAMGRKRPRSHMSSDTVLLSRKRKRNCSSSPTKDPSGSAAQNRVHRRVIVQDFGKPLYRASSHAAMLAALQSCLEGYRSLYIKTGLLQGDVSAGNLMMNDETGECLYSGFLIDLDLAIREKRTLPSGAWGKAGTRPFMPVGQLLGDKPSFVQGLESFFWVLLWICLHFDGPSDKGRVISEFDEWNYVGTEELAKLKLGTILDDLFPITMDQFTEYHQPLKRWVDQLRRAVFPKGSIRRKEDQHLFSRMLKILQDAEEDMKGRLK